MRLIMTSIIRIVAILSMTGFAPLFSQETHYLGYKDVKSIMNQIFDRHITQNKMTEEIFRNALRLYIEQFDPNKIYLLEWEVKPFINPSPYEMKQYLADYEKQNMTPFLKLNVVIQKSIQRARRLRSKMMAHRGGLFDARPSYSEPYPQYAKHKGELRSRMREDFMAFIDEQRRRYGKVAVDKRQDHIADRYGVEQRAWENGYLFVDPNGVALNERERTHQFTLHVLKALAKSLDAHTSFLDQSEAFTMRSRLLKGHPGTGIEFHQGIDGVIVADIVSSSPAARSGKVKVNDRLVKVNGNAIDNYTFKQVKDLLEGEDGALVSLTLQRPGESQPYTVDLKREMIISNKDRVETRSVPYGEGVIGEITLHSFYDSKNGISSEEDIRAALKKLRRQGPLKGLILDLRGNSGGYLSQAVKVAGLFITNGVIVISKYHNGEMNFYRDVDGKTYFDGPLVVLISRFTASAAEIVAQALQDYGVAVIVGDDRSYGKGSIQSQTVTGDERSSYFKVTVGKYYTVSGKTPQKSGVLADIVVPSKFAHADFGEKYLNNTLKADRIEPAFVDKLADVQPEAKAWYLRYYLPTLQPRKTSWQKMIPTLKKKSFSRIGAISDQGLTPDLQMKEAVNIVRDMIQMYSQLNRDQVGAYE